MFEISNSLYYRCKKTGIVAIANPADDKVWCPRCRRTHSPDEMDKATASDLEKQIKEFLAKV